MACFYRVIKAGDINRDETQNVAIVAYGRPDIEPRDTDFELRMLTNWTRFRAMCGWGDDLRDEIIKRLTAMKSIEDLVAEVGRAGPYTPFVFSEPRGSISSAKDTADSMARYFLYDSQCDTRKEPGVVLSLREAKATRAYFAGDHFESGDIETAWKKFNLVLDAASEAEA